MVGQLQQTRPLSADLLGAKEEKKSFFSHSFYPSSGCDCELAGADFFFGRVAPY